MSDPAGRLLRALRSSATASGCAVGVEIEATTPWASATFVGAQYRVAVVGDGLDAWLTGVPAVELPIPGGFVADCAIERTAAGAVLTVLVLEE